IVAGWFTSINSTTVGYIARLDSTGALDTTFSANIGTGFNDQVRDAIMQSDGSVVALGQFTSFDGTSVQRIARISSTGTLDTTFAASTSLNGTGDHIVAFDDGRMLVSGSFTGVNGTTRNRLAVLDADGALDAAFDPAVGPDTAPNAIAIDQAGRVLLAGTLGSYAGTGVPEVCRVLADGGLDPAFALATAPDDTAVGVAVQSTGRILFCGAFTTFNATAAGGVAAIESDERVSLIESHDSNGTYAAGSVLTIRVTFTGPVTVTTAGGTPSLTLNSGGTATYTSGSATTTLAFSYTVATGETSSDLDVTVLALNGGTIVDGSSNAVSLLVPVAGLPGSLASNNQLVISAASSSSGSGTNGGCAATLQPGSVWRLDLLAMLLLALTGLAWRRRFGGSCGCAF
ncbi:MAG: delta-60 repeat domain-containing protein, partial [Planctomycetota bacterium]